MYETTNDNVLIIKTSSTFKRDYILNSFTEIIKATAKEFPKISGINVE